ncbi:MAG: penicillin-binding transpeptidase domain-containing protein [Fibrobacterota bacterium]|nr:penicillin-binding transpeptidase domain-containing protein [Fibrobacterota bacterium]
MANKRILTIGFLLVLAWLGMFLRVAWVQVVKSDHYKEMASSQSIRRNVVAPKRGEILDRDLQKLVVNADVEMESGMRSDSKGKNIGTRMRRLSRVCPQGALAGQVLGTVGKDGYGQLGLEYFLDRELRGTDGWKYLRHDVKNRYYPGFEERQKEAINGMNVVLTLDSKLQEIVEQALERGVQKAGAKQGVAIVVDPYTGDILSMANYPFYNPNTRDGEDKDAWKNQAVVKVYEPGSTFKVITTAALLEEKLMKSTDSIDGEGGQYKISGQTIRDTHPYHMLSFTDALAYSSNICFAKVVTKLRPETFYKYIRSFGFGMKSGVGLPAEESGVLKAVGEWSGRTQSTIAFGHEISTTPLQVAMAISAIANGGLLMKPRIVKAWTDNSGSIVQELPPRTVRRVLSESTAEQVRAMMGAVVEYGTAKDIKSDRITMGGKTGTAEKIDAETGRYVEGLFNSSFMGMVPVDRPEFVCLVLLDEPSMFKYGGQSAAPIFREIVDRVMANPDYPLARRAVTPVETAGDSTLAPDLLGYRYADARKLLSGTRHGVKAEGAGEVVLSQEPCPGARLRASDTVVVSLGTLDSRVMPDLNNNTLRDALLKLKNLGMKVEYTGAGRIIRQEPPMGTPVKAGQKCSLTLGWMG